MNSNLLQIYLKKSYCGEKGEETGKYIMKNSTMKTWENLFKQCNLLTFVCLKLKNKIYTLGLVIGQALVIGQVDVFLSFFAVKL